MNNQPKQPLSHEYPAKIWNKSFINIFFTSIAFNLGLNMSNALISVYAQSLGVSVSVIGMVVSTYAVSAIVFRLISAPIMDTYNRKYVVVFATLIMAVTFWGFSLSRDVTSLMVFRLLQGCGMAFGNSCCLAMVSEMLPKEKYNTGMGYYSLAQVVTQAIGPGAGLWLTDRFGGYGTVYIVTACVMLIATVLAFQLKPKFNRTKKLKLSLKTVIAKKALLPASLLFLLTTGFYTVNAFLVIFAGAQGVTSNMGLYFTVYSCTMIITRPFVGKLTDKFGLVKVAIPALCCNVISFLIISYSTTLPDFLLAAFIMSFGHGACQPSIQALSMKTVSPERRGAASSTNYLGADFGALLGPTVAGGIAQSFGYAFMWRAMIVPFLMAMLIMFLLRNKIVSIEENFAP